MRAGDYVPNQSHQRYLIRLACSREMDLSSTEPTWSLHPHDSANTRAEIESFLAQDASVLGEVYRGLREGLHADDIAARSGTKTSNYVWNYSRIIRALLERDLPTAPTVALQVARKFRSLLRLQWSPDVRSQLEHDLEILTSRAADVDALVEESAAAIKNTTIAEDAAVPGIYVYALPHYLRYPVDPDSGRTLLKVGRSDRDVIQRMRDQTRTTALPEEPVLLRVYPAGSGDTADVEARIHKTLRAFDHGQTAARMAGREWFLTTITALDSLADLLGLSIIVVNDDSGAYEAP